MILYHYTRLQTVVPDLKKQIAGVTETGGLNVQLNPPALKATKDWFEGARPSPGKVVWLTGEPDAAIPLKSDCHPMDITVRLTLKLSSTDTRLVNWNKWQDRHWPEDVVQNVRGVPGYAEALGMAPNEMEHRAAKWWFYRGVIQPKRITNIAILRGEVPWFVCDEHSNPKGSLQAVPVLEAAE
jgi:hypothetical protein